MCNDLGARGDALVFDPCWAPYAGWHDDHRHLDGTPDYRPAVQQVRQEWLDLMAVCQQGGSALQLGLGTCDAPHWLLALVFDFSITVDSRRTIVHDVELPGLCTENAVDFVAKYGLYDLLFIDADHTYEGVKADHERYAPLVASGGIVAFHDASPKHTHREEMGVRGYLASFMGSQPADFNLHMIGDEVGVAWYRKP